LGNVRAVGGDEFAISCRLVNTVCEKNAKIAKRNWEKALCDMKEGRSFMSLRLLLNI
jgi:hypothetical protein